VLIANSSVTGPITAFAQYEGNPSITDIQKTLWAPSLEDSNAALGLNTMSTFYTCISFPHLLDAGNSHADSIGSKGYVQSQIIATSSIAGFARKDIIGYSYSASKAAVTHVTKMLSTQFAPYGIRANALAPGIYPSEATEVSSWVVRKKKS
jgi:NAD(P)-dependent dehydrogenase (short-subunit alcohol dehydrogenase family)